MSTTALELRQYCTFTLNGLLYGIDVSAVQEVIRFQDMTEVPLSHRVVRGLINLRGQIVTALDLRSRLALPERSATDKPMNIVVRLDDCAVSFLVDEIGDVVEVDSTTFERPPETLRGPSRALIVGAHKLDGRLLHVLDTARTAALNEDFGEDRSSH